MNFALFFYEMDLLYELSRYAGWDEDTYENKYKADLYERFLAYKQDIIENGYEGPTDGKEFGDTNGKVAEQLKKFLSEFGIEPKELGDENIANLLQSWYDYLLNSEFIVEG